MFRGVSRTGIAVAFLVFASAVGGCGSTTSVSEDAVANVKTVAVIPIFGNQLRVPGNCGRSSSATYLRIDNWGIDQLILREASTALSKHFAVKYVTPTKLVLQSGPPNTDDYIATLQNPGDVDAYLLVGPVMYRRGSIALHPFPDETYEGLGICHSPTRTFHGANDIAHAYYTVILVDARTGAWLASAASSDLSSGDSAVVEINHGLWAQDARSLTDNQKAQLQSVVSKLMADSLHATLRELRLE